MREKRQIIFYSKAHIVCNVMSVLHSLAREKDGLSFLGEEAAGTFGPPAPQNNPEYISDDMDETLTVAVVDAGSGRHSLTGAGSNPSLEGVGVFVVAIAGACHLNRAGDW